MERADVAMRGFGEAQRLRRVRGDIAAGYCFSGHGEGEGLVGFIADVQCSGWSWTFMGGFGWSFMGGFGMGGLGEMAVRVRISIMAYCIPLAAMKAVIPRESQSQVEDIWWDVTILKLLGGTFCGRGCCYVVLLLLVMCVNTLAKRRREA